MTCRLLPVSLLVVWVLNIKPFSCFPAEFEKETSSDSKLDAEYVEMIGSHGVENRSDGFQLYEEYDDVLEGEEYIHSIDVNKSIDQFNGTQEVNTKDNKFSRNLTDEFMNSTRQVPEYMLELYDTFSKSGQHRPKSDIIRSFMNTNEETKVNRTQKDYPEARIHRLVFNITTIMVHEVIKLAELRLYTLVEKDRYMYIGIDRRVSVFEIIYNGGNVPDVYRLISSRHIYERDNGWETFEVTSAVKRWIQNINSVQILEIRIESVFQSVTQGDIDIRTKPRDRNEPLLIVYSNDSKKHLRHRELDELISHEMATVYERMTSKVTNRTLHREKRSRRMRRRRNSSCRRTPMYVNFRDINWARWIISPRGYEAYECTGKCYYPISQHLTPSKHAIIQTLLFSSYPRKAHRPCCVPTQLEPISLLYIEGNVITFKHKYVGTPTYTFVSTRDQCYRNVIFCAEDWPSSDTIINQLHHQCVHIRGKQNVPSGS